jgi:PAS domain S-box-containing protein
MQLRLRTKLTLEMTGLVLLVVAILSGFFVAQLLQQTLQQTDKRTKEVAQQVFELAKGALTDAAEQGLRPASAAPADIRAYVERVFEANDALQGEMKAANLDTPAIYEVSIADHDGMVLTSTDKRLLGKNLPHRPALPQLTGHGLAHQVRVLAGPGRQFEYVLPFIQQTGEPFGEVRVIVDSKFLLNSEISPSVRKFGTTVILALLISTVLAAVVSRMTLAPLSHIAAQLDRISAGQYDAPSMPVKELPDGADELGQVSRKITQVGQQLRGVHEIFSTLRENMDSVMAGLEDGLLLFTRDARAVMVSPAAEKFLGAPPGHFLGRRVNEIFPVGHPLHEVLRIEGDYLNEIAAETDLETKEGTKRVSVNVQAIQEDGERMGALVTLRDLDSIESINTQLQVSERLAALGRVTAGVAHEVKNPLNSMRLWLENLKESLSFQDSDNGAQQAVQVLDKEIDRLDEVVKRFLDFTRPMDVRLEPTQLAELLNEVLEVAQPQLRKANIHVARLLPTEVPEVYVDRALLRQAVLNLVLNAVEAMPGGGQLRLTLNRRGEMAEIVVADTGKGIPVENRQKVFQLFFTTRPGGSGIGLASTFRIVQLHNGSIDFTSEVGRGTTFRIELPLAA